MAQDSVKKPKVLVIGGSAGSLEIILKALPRLNSNIPLAIVIVLHRKNSFDTTLTDLLSSRTKIPVNEVEEKQRVKTCNIYIAPPDYHLLFEKDNTFGLDFSEKINYSRPSIDVAFESAADVYNNGLACLLLSGANADGVSGLKIAKYKGAIIAVQDPSEAEVSYMPQQALSSLEVDYVLKNNEIAEFINNLSTIL
jgi:two-component system chemotaxis response regulator CheB